MISTSEWHAEHRFADRNIQQTGGYNVSKKEKRKKQNKIKLDD